MARIIIEDTSDYAKREHGTLYWAGSAWSATLDDARVFPNEAAAQRLLDGFAAARAAQCERLGIADSCGAGYVPVFRDLDAMRAQQAAFGVYRVTICAGYFGA